MGMELRTVENREGGLETPGQRPSMAGSAVMILHGFRMGSPVVTDTGCCPSAARRRRPDLRMHSPNRPFASSHLRELDQRRPCDRLDLSNRWRPLMPLCSTLPQGPSADRGVQSRPVAEASGVQSPRPVTGSAGQVRQVCWAMKVLLAPDVDGLAANRQRLGDLGNRP
jgi:hypothetical protein